MILGFLCFYEILNHTSTSLSVKVHDDTKLVFNKTQSPFSIIASQLIYKI
jgi:hypothetical protein